MRLVALYFKHQCRRSGVWWDLALSCKTLSLLVRFATYDLERAKELSEGFMVDGDLVYVTDRHEYLWEPCPSGGKPGICLRPHLYLEIWPAGTGRAYRLDKKLQVAEC